jgi:hypothetical protein
MERSFFEENAEAMRKQVIKLLESLQNRCVCCGEIIPEGRQVCPMCEKKGYKDDN